MSFLDVDNRDASGCYTCKKSYIDRTQGKWLPTELSQMCAVPYGIYLSYHRLVGSFRFGTSKRKNIKYPNII